MSAPRVAVIGAGALGLACALRLAEDGWRVDVHAASTARGASAVAAGMLAPASEAVLDGAGPYALLVEARDAWARRAPGVPWLLREGAFHLEPAGGAAGRLEALRTVGAEARLAPSPVAAEEAVFTPEDWRLVVDEALAWFDAALAARGVRVRSGPALPAAAISPAHLGVDAVVLAAGWGAASLGAVAPEAALLSPIKGQLMRAPGVGPAHGPALRIEGAYLVPDPAGLIVGATMEAGLSDTVATPEAAAMLRAAALPFAPELAHAALTMAAGVRATTPDGLPLVGPSTAASVWWAAGARRNGWLLAPLVAEVLTARMAGLDGGRWAARLDPGRRFAPQAL